MLLRTAMMEAAKAIGYTVAGEWTLHSGETTERMHAIVTRLEQTLTKLM
jgi:hypothetical protein